jgi:hypothetical protein
LKRVLIALALFTLVGVSLARAQATSATLELNVVLPAVRGTIQSKDPVKKLMVDGLVNYSGSEKLIVECQGVDANGKTVSTAKAKVSAAKAFRMELNLRRLAVGSYQFTFKLMASGQEAASQVVPIIVAPPAQTEVTFDDKRVCYVNGKPFFPIGLYHVSPAAVLGVNARSSAAGLPGIDLFESIKQVRAMGFNVIHHTWGMPKEDYLAYTEKLGMWVIPEVAAPTAEDVALANRHTNVLMWYGSDEPSGETLNVIKRARAQTALLDPHRPVSAAVCNPNLFRAALEGFDFVMLDPYLIRHAPLTNIADWMKAASDAGNGSKAIWLVPQAFTIDSSYWKEPTPEELRCQAYIGLVHGATGFVWYAFWSSEDWSGNPKGRGCWYLPDSKLWDAFPKLNAEVSALAPIILTGQNLGPVRSSAADVHTCLWKYRGKSYLLAVNTQYHAVKCKLEGFGAQADVMFESRKVTTDAGVLSENFLPLEAHVYRF